MSAIHWRIEEFDEIDSTNTWLATQAREGAPEGLVARADFQTHGRGRLDRSWEAERGGSLLMSVLLRRDLPSPLTHFITVVLALSTRAALVRLSGLRPDLKWPNDLVVGPNKLGGVLAELVTDHAGASAQVVGVGVNLSYPGPDDLAVTCVTDETGLTISPQSLCDMVIDELDRRLPLLEEPGLPTLRTEYATSLATLGQRVRLEGPGGELEGVGQWVDQFGRLVVLADSGRRHVFDVGDVTHLRPISEPG